MTLLPPLPPVGGETTGPSVVDVIEREHRELIALCDELTGDGTDAARRQTLAQVISAELSRHLSAEEQYLYPAVKATVPMVDFPPKSHDGARAFLEVACPPSPLFGNWCGASGCCGAGATIWTASCR